eukprot:m.224713 g.224713  ORF g.224713 m.224713 type:complete len:887 (+) comp17298_c0_seq1:2895-5555(+)
MTTAEDAFLLNSKEDFIRAVHSKKCSKCQRLVHHAGTRGLTDRFFKLLGQDTDVIFKAAQSGDPVILKMLHDGGLAFDIADSHQNTPLIVAASSGKAEGVRFLLTIPQVKMAINGKRTDGNTALHRAAEAGSLVVVQLLVNSQANFSAQNNKAQTPLDRAKKKNKRDVVKYLTAIMNGTTPTASTNASSSALGPMSLTPSLPSTSDAASMFSYERRLSDTSAISDMSMLSLGDRNIRSNTNESSGIKSSRSPDAPRSRTNTSDNPRSNTMASSGSANSLHVDKQVRGLQTEKKLLEAQVHQLQEDFDVTHQALNDTSAELHRLQLAQDAAAVTTINLATFEIGMGQLGKLTKLVGTKSGSKTNVVASKYRSTPVALVNAYISRQQMEIIAEASKTSPLVKDLQAVLELKHPRLLTCFGYLYYGNDVDSATMCMIFDRPAAVPLHELMYSSEAEERLLVDWTNPRVRLQAVADVAAGLTFMHHSGLVHGQVSPHSVMIDEAGRGVLSHAGLPLCRLLAGKNLSATAWSSPELASDPKDPQVWQRLDSATDVYSLGVVLVELLAQWDAEGKVSLEDAVNTIEETCCQLLARSMTAAESVGRPSLLAVSQVLSILRSRKSELDLSKCKVMLTGPPDAPWKLPKDLQPVTNEAAFSKQIKGLPCGSAEAFSILKMDKAGVSPDTAKVHFLLKPDAEVGFYNTVLHWGAIMQGAQDDSNHPYHPTFKKSKQALRVLAALDEHGLRLNHEAVPEHVRVFRCYLPFEGVKAGNRALLEGLAKQPMTIDMVPTHGVCLSLDLHDAMGRSQLASGGDPTILVCDVCVANPFPLTTPPKQATDIVPPGYDCAVRLVKPQPNSSKQASNGPVAELVLQCAAMVLPRAMLSIDNGSLV